jgi:hypothetical protein
MSALGQERTSSIAERCPLCAMCGRLRVGTSSHAEVALSKDDAKHIYYSLFDTHVLRFGGTMERAAERQ